MLTLDIIDDFLLNDFFRFRSSGCAARVEINGDHGGFQRTDLFKIQSRMRFDLLVRPSRRKNAGSSLSAF